MPPAKPKSVVKKRSSKSVKPKKTVIPKRTSYVRKQVKSIVSDCKGVCNLQERQLRNLADQTIRSLKEDHANRVRTLQNEMNELRLLGDSSEIKKELSLIQQELKDERENVARKLKEAIENANRIHSENLDKIQSNHSSELSRMKDEQTQYCEISKKEISDKLMNSMNELKQLEQNLKEIRERKDDLEREIAELRSNNAKANSDEIDRLKAELQEEKQSMLSVQSFIENYREEIRDLKRERDELQKEHSECKSAREKLQGELSAIQERMKNECQDSKEEMRRQFEDEKVALNKTIAELKAVKSAVSSTGPDIGDIGNAPKIQSSDPRSSLLSAIKAGTQLKKVQGENKSKKPVDGPLAQIIGRRAAITGDEKDGEWDFRARRSRSKKSKKRKSKKSGKSKKSLRRKH